MRKEILAEDILLHKAKIADAGSLVKSGALPMTLKETQDFLRIPQVREDVCDYCTSDFLARLTSVNNDETRRMVSIYSGVSDESRLYQIMDELARKCFFRENIRKLSILITSEDTLLESVIMSIGYNQEALLRDEIMTVKDGRRIYSDAGLFSIQRAEYTNYNVAFVPFQRGVVAISGGADYIDSVSFLSYDAPIEDLYVCECAWYQGLTSEEGTLLPRSGFPRDYSMEYFSFMPAELVRTCDELREYFHKERETFDINVKLYDASEFQIAVWDALKTIPYGVTCSYEDIALKLTDNDLPRARKLTRAVGKACSENPVPIVVPCHRVIGKNGMLVGFSGGIEFKDFLLQNELFMTAFPLN